MATRQIACDTCAVRNRAVCGALSDEEISRLNGIAHFKQFPAGSVIHRDHDEPGYFANVVSGVVKLTKTLSDGRQQIVGLQFAPDFVGRPFRTESALTAEAATGVELCSFPRRAVERMIADQPDLQNRLLKQTLKELDQARDWMVTLGRKTAAEKVASFLLMIARNIHPTEAGETRRAAFDLPLSRADIADFLGLTIETVSRQMTRLRMDGIIRVEHNRHITVDDLERLSSRAGD